MVQCRCREGVSATLATTFGEDVAGISLGKLRHEVDGTYAVQERALVVILFGLVEIIANPIAILILGLAEELAAAGDYQFDPSRAVVGTYAPWLCAIAVVEDLNGVFTFGDGHHQVPFEHLATP